MQDKNYLIIDDLQAIFGYMNYKIFIRPQNIIFLCNSLAELSSGIRKNIQIIIDINAAIEYEKNKKKNYQILENYISVQKKRFGLADPSKLFTVKLETIDFGIIVPQIFE